MPEMRLALVAWKHFLEEGGNPDKQIEQATPGQESAEYQPPQQGDSQFLGHFFPGEVQQDIYADAGGTVRLTAQAAQAGHHTFLHFGGEGDFVREICFQQRDAPASDVRLASRFQKDRALRAAFAAARALVQFVLY